MPRFFNSRPFCYGFALLSVVVATGLRFAVVPLLGSRQPFVLYYLAVILAAWRCGLGASILAMFLGSVSAVLFFILPYHPHGLTDFGDYLGVGLFFMVCSAIVAFSESNRKSNCRLSREIDNCEQARKSEKLQREWLQATLASVGDGVIATDREGRAVLINSVAQGLNGWTQEEAIGRPVEELFCILNEQTRAVVENPVRTVLRDGRISRLADHTILIAKDGRETAIEDSAAPIRDQDGAVSGVVLIFRGVSDRKQHEATIDEQRGLAEFGRDVGLASTESSDLTEMLNRCSELTNRHLRGAFTRIWTLNEAGDMLELRASAGMYTHLNGSHARVPIGQYKIGMIAKNRTPHLTNSVIGDPLISAQGWAERQGMVAFAGYPLIVDDRLVGVWAMFARHELSDITLRAMESVASGIAIGIERKLAGEALAESEAWLSTTLKSIGDGVIATDTEGCVRFLNPLAEAMTGWTQDEARGRQMEEVFHIVNETTRKGVENPVQRVIREGRIVGLANHTILIAKDGNETPIEDSAAPIRDADGRISGVVMVFRDVTEEKLAQRLVLDSEARKAAILESALDGIVTINHEGIILEFNPAAERMFGRDRQETLGREIGEILIPPSHREAHQRGMDHLNATGEGPIIGRRIEISAMRFDGSEFPAELTVTQISTPGMPLFTAHIRDITEKKLYAEERDQLLAEAQEANRAKTHFLAVLSHELRTPLNPILLAVTSMLERPIPVEDVRPNLEMIRTYVSLQSRLIDDLLDVMRIVQGKMPLQWEVADGHHLIRQAIQICQSEFHAKGLRIEPDLAATQYHINADPARLHQVFWNLIKNAVKFTPAGGAIVIRTRNLDGDRLSIEVCDTGIGIEADLLSRIFDPFQQGETSITRRFGGLGLGLAIGKGIVDGHGGVLSVESAGKNQGTTFRIELQSMPEPISDRDDRPAISTIGPQEPATLRNRNILLVEDEQATIRLMARLLRSLGHNVSTAATIEAAIEVEREGEFDLIISDIGLPDGSGLELMRQIVVRRGPVQSIALTGYGMEEDIQRSRDAGFTAHMTKPIDFTKLEMLIWQLSSSRA